MFLSLICLSVNSSMFPMIFAISTGSCVSFILLPSISLYSITSFMKLRRRCADSRTLLRILFWSSASSGFLDAISTIPIIPLIGVLISCDICDINSLFDLSALLATTRASISSLSCFCLIVIISVTS